jgi:catechol 2,3-dioxygenase-like lactoylglutathione lyase family enzyme
MESIYASQLQKVETVMSKGDTVKKPRIFGIHHIGINVPDLEAGRRFYESVFGFEVVGVDNWGEGNKDINAYVGLDESAADSYMLRGCNTFLELWTYRTPASTTSAFDRVASDHGYTHVAFSVMDFDAVLEDLLQAGGSLIKPLTDARPGGAKIHYCRDPFGNIIELLELPEEAGGHVRSLPGVERDGVFAEPADEYYVFEDGAFQGMRSKEELP